MDRTNPPGPPLRIDDLIGHRLILQPGQEATIGRAGSFPVGADDPYLHRVFLQLWYGGQGWMVSNRGTHLSLEIETRSRLTRSQITVGPGSVIPIPQGPTAVAFATRERSYELHIDIPTHGITAPGKVTVGPRTASTFARHIPSEEQQELMDALAEPLLKHVGVREDVIPTVKEVAGRLGWTEKKTNQKIERLCKRLASDGEDVYKPYRIFLAKYAARRYAR